MREPPPVAPPMSSNSGLLEQPSANVLTVSPKANRRAKRNHLGLLPVSTRWSLVDQLEAERSNSRLLSAALDHEQRRAEAAETHCHFALDEVGHLKRQLNAKNQPRNPEKLRAQHISFVNGPRAMELYEEQERQDAEKRMSEMMKEQAKKNKQVANQDRRAQLAMDGDRVRFTKPIASYKKDELRDLLFVLGMDTEEKETVKHRQERLQEHFEARPHLRNDARFRGMFATRRRADEENLMTVNATMLTAAGGSRGSGPDYASPSFTATHTEFSH